MSKGRLGMALGLLATALIAGLYFSGLLTLWLLRLHGQVPLAWDTWWRYFQVRGQPGYAVFAGRVEVAGAVGFGLPLLVWLGLLVPILKPRRRSLHGDARFARRGELAKCGLFNVSPNGIVVGRYGNNLLRLGGTRHALLAAPTRSGKGVGAVIPNLLTFEDSVVVLDIKQEAFELTSGWRSRLGPVYLFNPFAEDLRTHRWNPLSYVSAEPSLRITDLQAIAAILYEDDSSRESFWANQARNAFLAASLYLFETRDADAAELPEALCRPVPTLGQVYRLFSGDGTELKPYLEKLAQAPGLSHDCKTAFRNLLALAEQTFASVVGSFQEPLHVFLNPILDKATSGDDFRLTDLRRRPMTIYVGITPNKLAEARKLINLFFSQVINQNVRELPEKNPVLKHQCLLLLDEFTALGRIDIIATAASYLAGYNLRLFPVIQSLSQLDAVYGPDVARSLVTNLAAQIIYTPREQRDANEYSEMLGYTTLRRKQKTRSRGLGQGRNVSYSDTEERRALLLPQELKALSPEREIVFIEGLAHPIQCDKIRYYKERFFKARVLKKAAVKTLTMGEAAVNTKQALAAVAVAGIALTLGACGTASGKPKIQLNPHPKQKYEITVTTDAPGPFDAATGTVLYQTDTNCVPTQPVLGGEPDRPEFTQKIALTRVDGHTYKGDIYLDLLENADYFGLGVCHWSINTVSAGFEVHGLEFDAALGLDEVRAQKSATWYTPKQDYFDKSAHFRSWSNPMNEDMAKHRDRYFSVTVTLRKVGP